MNPPILPPIIVEVVATLSGVIVSIGVPLILSKLNKIDKLHTTVFGLREVSTVGGLVDDVNDIDSEISEIEETAQEMDDRVVDLEDDIEDLKQRQEKILEKLREMSSSSSGD